MRSTTKLLNERVNFFPGTAIELGCVLLKDWLIDDDLHALSEAAKSDSSFCPGDRGKKLIFQHKVLRIENSLFRSKTWFKLLATFKAIDREVWNTLKSSETKTGFSVLPSLLSGI
jgi:hypothetical protein